MTYAEHTALLLAMLEELLSKDDFTDVTTPPHVVTDFLIKQANSDTIDDADMDLSDAILVLSRFTLGRKS